MVFKILPDRKIFTLTKVISDHVKIETLVITDRYPSYSKPVKNSFFSHEIVKHNKGFKNNEGYHTNNIENLWSQLRYEEKKRLGIKKSYIYSFLNEFIRQYYNLKNYEFELIGEKWIDIIIYLLNKNI
ncbi:hypothetical protein DMUE_5618 [Dictyocoela muelleri]|nr:hypothetical protein DMUE_5618 [Dictyocoela muelleri]